MRRGVPMPEEQILLEKQAQRAVRRRGARRAEEPDDPYAGAGVDLRSAARSAQGRLAAVRLLRPVRARGARGARCWSCDATRGHTAPPRGGLGRRPTCRSTCSPAACPGRTSSATTRTSRSSRRCSASRSRRRAAAMALGARSALGRRATSRRSPRLRVSGWGSTRVAGTMRSPVTLTVERVRRRIERWATQLGSFRALR